MPQADNTALIALIGFILVTLAGGAMTFVKHNELNAYTPEAGEFGFPPGDAEEPGLKEQFAMASGDLQKWEKDLRDRNRELTELESEVLTVKKAYLIKAADLQRHMADWKWFEAKSAINATATERIEEVKNEVVSDKDRWIDKLRAFRDRKDREFNEVRRKLQSGIDHNNQQILAENTRFKNQMEQNRKTRSRELTRLNQAKAELEKITARERVRTDIEADGKVVRSDLELKLAIINRGAASGVKKGYRFEVFQLKQGNRRVHKGFIEVKDVDAETASCIIVERMVRLPRDPVTAYVAALPEEMFSPYTSGGATGLQVQRLTAKAKVVVFGMNKDDPIVPGDLISNPFYDRGRPLRFAVKGEKIKYPRSYIIRLIRQYGGMIDEKVTAKTDYLIAGKWAREDAKRARELGVKIFYEFELFRFLAK